jgi:NAD(P)-dependent dehydrogenase (short-subunit alcohol dehydrogenase family)
MTDLNGKIALITGAKGGLGTFVTNAFLDAGASVAGVSRSIRASDFPHPDFHAFAVALSSADNANSVVAAVNAELGRIDVLVHLLGGFAGGVSVTETADTTFDQMIDVNLRSTFLITRAVLPQMRAAGRGRLVAVGSRAAVDANAGAGVYSASKAALIALMRAIALENADRCISANVVLPGTMDTPANRAADSGADHSRWVQPAQVANLILALSSEGLAQVNGAVVPVYGREV